MTEQVFVGRDLEHSRLQVFFDRALAGQGRVIFVTGEAGSGKTALARAFAVQMQTAHEHVLVAMGNCNAQGGLGDPYLPFREVLAVLTGLSETPAVQDVGHLKKLLVRSAQVLVDVGPDLIGTIVPGASLVATIGKAVAQRVGWMDELSKLVNRKQSGGMGIEQSRIFEQYANVLRALSRDQPLLVIVDDLHWADDASIGLLFHLSRRLQGCPVLIVGTYRPDEVALLRGAERHPLERVLSEIKRYAGDVSVDLGETAEGDRQAFVNSLLDSEPNNLDGAFREQLYRRTGGHALFTVELLRTL